MPPFSETKSDHWRIKQTSHLGFTLSFISLLLSQIYQRRTMADPLHYIKSFCNEHWWWDQVWNMFRRLSVDVFKTISLGRGSSNLSLPPVQQIAELYALWFETLNNSQIISYLHLQRKDSNVATVLLQKFISILHQIFYLAVFNWEEEL